MSINYSNNSPETNILVDPDTTPTKKYKYTKEHQQFLDNYIWRSCCGIQIDKRVVVFTSQFIIALMIVSFSLYQLNKSNNCEHNQLYTGLLTMIVGIFLPSPRVK